MCTTTELNNVQGSAQPCPQGAFPKAREKRPGDKVGVSGAIRGRSRGKPGANWRAVSNSRLLWGFPVTKTMPMVQLCVEWLRMLFAF